MNRRIDGEGQKQGYKVNGVITGRYAEMGDTAQALNATYTRK